MTHKMHEMGPATRLKIVVHRPDKDYRSGETPTAICGVYGGNTLPLDLVVQTCSIWEKYVNDAPREAYEFCDKCE